MKASPKHPQSLTGLVIAKTRVSGVKMTMKSKAPHAAHFVLIFRKRQMPTVNSKRDSKKEKDKAAGFKMLKWKALK